jgi:uncharacterized protein (TIGR02246 family)
MPDGHAEAPAAPALGQGDEAAVRALHAALLGGWNRRSAEAFAAPFAEDGQVVGFDGTEHSGREQITGDLQRIFTDHVTPAYVGRVREVRLVAPDVALLRAVAGLVPPGGSDLLPELNAVQTLVAARRGGGWRIVLFQSTPAQYHGRPELSRRLTDELREVLRGTGDPATG